MALGSGLLQRFMRRQDDETRRAFAPPDKVLYVVGDIHGRADLLHALLRKIAIDAARHEADLPREVIFLGDYIDRGPDSRQAVDLVLSTIAEKRFWDVTVLKGNHEEAMLRFMRDASYWPIWSQYGARETVLSYGVTPPRMTSDSDAWEEVRERLRDAVPPDHWDFFSRLELSAERGDYLCVHAGVRPNVPLDRQTEQDLLWIRDDFLAREHVFEKVIVHGHTPGQPFSGPHRIALDTGAYVTGILTAIKLKGEDRLLIQVHGDSEFARGTS
jgi:serine/threonine protein phosphatase 1